MNSEWNRASISESSDDRLLWKVNAHERPAGLAIILSMRTYILPWCQFIYAEVRAEEIRLAGPIDCRSISSKDQRISRARREIG
jgi:hypothetical protein